MKNLGSLIIGLIIGALIMYFYCCKETKDVTTVTPTVTPRGVITPAEAKTLNSNWTNLRKAANDAVAQNKIDNRSSWYSIKDVRDYLNLVEKENSKVTGIRLYLGVDGDIAAGGKTTIFMIPTTPVGTGSRSGGDPNLDDPNGSGLDRGHAGIPPGQGYPN